MVTGGDCARKGNTFVAYIFFISQIVQDIIKYKMSFTSIILIKADHLLLQPSCSVKYL